MTVASQAGLEGQAGQLAYATSKAGVAGMALPMARDLAWYAIRTIAICPSIFETPLSATMPERARQKTLKTAEFPARFGKADEFGHAVQSVIENDMLNGFALSEFWGRRQSTVEGATDEKPCSRLSAFYSPRLQGSTVQHDWPSYERLPDHASAELNTIYTQSMTVHILRRFMSENKAGRAALLEGPAPATYTLFAQHQQDTRCSITKLRHVAMIQR